MARPTSFAAFVLCALLCAQLASAYPSLWASESDVKCPDHPKKAEDGHKAPVADSAVKFAVLDKTGKAVTAVCPGAAYTVQVSFPQPRLALLTADAGKFAKSDAKCPSRQVIDRTKSFTPSATQAAELTVPCTLATPLVLKVTSATGSSGAFQQATSTLPVSPKCKVATCV